MKVESARLVDWPKNLNLNAIHEQFSSPAWIVCEKQLIINVDEYAAFTGDKGRICYPVKTNPSLTVLQLLAKQGVGADCASQLEINLALFAGIPIQNISYNSPVQDIRICESVLRAGGHVVMDDLDAIVELQQSLTTRVFKGKLFLRLNLPEYIGYISKNENQELMAHGHKSSKFGLPAEELEIILSEIKLPISGLHVHVGTQMDNMESFEHAMHSLNTLAENLNEQGHSITEINLGGGLGIPFDQHQKFPSLASWCERMISLKKENYNYSVEPGHALVGNAVSLLTCVQTVKKSRGKKWAIVDVGTDQLTKVTLLKWPHRILNASGEELAEGCDAIAGPLCFAGDTLKENIDANPLKKGTPLLITEAGAYTFSLSNKFNGRTAPKWLLLKTDDSLVQTMEKESIYDELHHSRYDWSAIETNTTTEQIPLSLVSQLSSKYLFQTCEHDRFDYLNVIRENKYTYTFVVATSSLVDFISMPFIIRIIGDAAITCLLHSKGFYEKDFAVWGRKLTLDCYEQLTSSEPLQFSIALSETMEKGKQHVVVARFKTACGKCAGSLIMSHEN